MPKSPKTSVIIVSFNTREILRACITRLYEVARDLEIELIVVDNNSRDASADMVERDFPAAKLIRSGTNLGFAAANNVGFKHASGEFVLLLNPDALLEPGALQTALGHMAANPAIGMGGGMLLDKAGVKQPSARKYPSLLNELLVISGLAARFPKSRFFGRFDRTWDDSGRHDEQRRGPHERHPADVLRRGWGESACRSESRWDQSTSHPDGGRNHAASAHRLLAT